MSKKTNVIYKKIKIVKEDDLMKMRRETETRKSFYFVPCLMLGLAAFNMLKNEAMQSGPLIQTEAQVIELTNDLEMASVSDPEVAFYENIVMVGNVESYLILVNKNHALNEDYSPSDLALLNVLDSNQLANTNIYLRSRAAIMAEQLFQAAQEEGGFLLLARSGYRSYQTQSEIYQNYVKKYGQEEADRFSARAGHSEHQTGLALDVTAESVNGQLVTSFGETEEGQWLKENAHRFGFIVRYQEGCEEKTGYMYEPWHIRYVGLNTAAIIYQNGWTLEEYIENQ